MSALRIDHGFDAGALGRVVELHGLYYTKHWGFGTYFEAIVAEGLAGLAHRYAPERDRIFLAKSAGAIVGSVSIDSEGKEDGTAKLRWFILDEKAQGAGIGTRLMTAAMDFVQSAGHRHVALDTFEGLDAACRLYEKHGFVQTGRTPGDRAYGPPVDSLHYVWERGASLP